MRIDAATVVTGLLAGAVGVGVGLWLGGRPSEEWPSGAVAPRGATPSAAPATSTPEAPVLRGDPTPPDASRVEALEETVDDLREEIATLRAELETARKAAEPAGSGERRASRVTAGPGNDAVVLDVADRLALEGGRRVAFLQAVRDAERRLQELEARHATRTVEGGRTTIRVESLGDEGKRFLQDWQDWVERNLSTEERRRYGDQGGEGMLWGWRTDTTRTITIGPSKEGTWTVDEEAVDGAGGRSRRTSRGPDGAALQAPYRHLLPR